MENKITFEMVQNWLGSDENYHLEEAIKIIASIANGEYEPKELASDIISYEE